MWVNLENAFAEKMSDLLEIKTNAENLIKPKNLIWAFSNEQRGSKGHYYGLVWEIKDTQIKETVYSFGFKIEISSESIYMGIRLLENNVEISDKDGIFEKYRDFDNFDFKNMGIDWHVITADDIQTNPWWLSRYLIKKNATNLDFTNFNTKAIFSIVQPSDCKAFAAEVAEAAHSIITQFKKNLQKKQ